MEKQVDVAILRNKCMVPFKLINERGISGEISGSFTLICRD
jgi:hypothetical protein